MPPAHFPPVGGAYAGRLTVLNADAVDERVGDDGEVRTRTSRCEIGEGTTHPDAVRNVFRGWTDAWVLPSVAVEIVEPREAQFLRGSDAGPVDRVQVGLDRAEHWHRAVDAMIGTAEWVRL